MNRSIFAGWVGSCSVLLLLATSGLLSAADNGEKAAAKQPKPDPRIGGMQLLPGYKHLKLQGIDSIVGKVEKAGGLSIMYDIGNIPLPGGLAFGGSFSDRPKNMPAKTRHWYKEQTVNGRPVHIAYGKNGYLSVSVQQGKKGINFGVKVKNTEEIVEALLMILTYPTKE